MSFNSNIRKITSFSRELNNWRIVTWNCGGIAAINKQLLWFSFIWRRTSSEIKRGGKRVFNSLKFISLSEFDRVRPNVRCKKMRISTNSEQRAEQKTLELLFHYFSSSNKWGNKKLKHKFTNILFDEHRGDIN